MLFRRSGRRLRRRDTSTLCYLHPRRGQQWTRSPHRNDHPPTYGRQRSILSQHTGGLLQGERAGAFKFQGTINRVKLDASIRPARNGAFEFEVETEGANLKGFANPVTVILTIGDDGGSRTVKAEIE